MVHIGIPFSGSNLDIFMGNILALKLPLKDKYLCTGKFYYNLFHVTKCLFDLMLKKTLVFEFLKIIYIMHKIN